MKMIIGVCDDCVDQVELVTNYINKYIIQDDFEVYTETDPKKFLSKYGEIQAQIVFLDIDMDGMDGIRLGECIREINDDSVIVYITGHDDYALEAFGVRAYHYLLKPVSENKFKSVLEDAIKTADLIQLKKAKKGKFIFKSQNALESIAYESICYFEKIGRKIKIQTDTDAIEFYGKFVDLIEQLDQNCFVQCHQGFIINKDKIISYKSNTLCMTRCEMVPVSRSYHKAIKNMIESLLFDEGMI